MRKALAARREHISAETRRVDADALALVGIGFCGAAHGAVVSGYAAIGSELDVMPLMARLSSECFITCLSVLQPLGQPLAFRAWVPEEPLVERKWGIREPHETAREVEPDVLLVPLLAFDAAGYRLGYGGGYFDRTLVALSRRKRIIAIGVAFDSQEVDGVPCDTFDQRLDWVLTPSGPRRTRG